MRSVLDTNVVLSALLWRGTPHHLLAAIGQRSSILFCSSTAMLEELADVLTRPSATKRRALIGRSAREVLADYVEAIELVEPASVPRVVAGDVDDDQVIATAVAARADLIGSETASICCPWVVIRASTVFMRLRRSGASPAVDSQPSLR